MKEATTRRAATDPVCGAAIDPEEAEGRRDFEGRTYLFCSLDCIAEFDAAPHEHAPAPLAEGV
jgi:Cu+-exporting ATPase